MRRFWQRIKQIITPQTETERALQQISRFREEIAKYRTESTALAKESKGFDEYLQKYNILGKKQEELSNEWQSLNFDDPNYVQKSKKLGKEIEELEQQMKTLSENFHK